MGVAKPLISDDAIIDPTGYVTERAVLCPKCRYSYSHTLDLFTRLGSDPYEAGIHGGTRALGCAHSRRSCLVIVFEGECGHLFEWRIQQSKGENFVTAEFVSDLVWAEPGCRVRTSRYIVSGHSDNNQEPR